MDRQGEACRSQNCPNIIMEQENIQHLDDCQSERHQYYVALRSVYEELKQEFPDMTDVAFCNIFNLAVMQRVLNSLLSIGH